MSIPFWIRLLHNFGRSSFIIGFLFGLIGFSFIVYFSFQLNWKILLADKSDFSLAPAYISECNKAPYTVNNNPLFEYHYTYSVNGNAPVSGSFLEYAESYSTGEQIQVEYLIDHPAISRFTGRDRRNYDQIMFLGGVGGLLVGFFFLYSSIRKTRRERKILITGIPAKGKLIQAEPTNLKVNEQTVYNLTFEYTTGQNKTQMFSLRSHMIRNLSEKHYETIVYDPGEPSSAVIINTLPGTVARYVNKKLEHSCN